jgi:hypothetical protein
MSTNKKPEGVRIRPVVETKVISPLPSKAWETQIGGTHYQDLAIQPMEYSMRNELNALAHSIIKYATRAGRKGGHDGHKKDIEKIIHCAGLWLEYIGDEDV